MNYRDAVREVEILEEQRRKEIAHVKQGKTGTAAQYAADTDKVVGDYSILIKRATDKAIMLGIGEILEALRR